MKKVLFLTLVSFGLFSCEKEPLQPTPQPTTPTEIRVVKSGYLDKYYAYLNNDWNNPVDNGVWGNGTSSKTYTLYKVNDKFEFEAGWYPIMGPNWNNNLHAELKVYANNVLIGTVDVYANDNKHFEYTKTK